MKTEYIVRSPLNHDNVFYGEGDRIELDDKAAQPLVDSDVVAVAAVEEPSKRKGKVAGKSE